MATGNPFMGKARGKLGDTVLQVLKGQQVTKAYNPHPANPRTPSQLNQRVKLASAVAFYRRHKQFFKSAFREKKPLESDYNAFIRENINIAPYLSREDLAHGHAYIAPYVMTRGTLPEVSFSYVETFLETDLLLYGCYGFISFDRVLSDYTVKALREGLGLEFGDMLTIYCETFAFGSRLLFPDKKTFSVENHFAKIIFTPEIDALELSTNMFEYSDGFIGAEVYNDDVLGISGLFTWFLHEEDIKGKYYDVFSAAACAVVSKKLNGSGLQVSTSRMTLGSMAQQVYDIMRTEFARLVAIESYGKAETAFLDPGEGVVTEG